MQYEHSETDRAASGADTPGGGAPQPVKFLVAGGFGVGKTTLVGAISEIDATKRNPVLISTMTCSTVP